MTEPITVGEALKALRMAQEVDGRAEVGPWARPDDVFDPADADAIVLWRQCFAGMVEYLIHGLSRHRPHDKLGAGVFYDAIAPIVQWARTREDWSR